MEGVENSANNATKEVKGFVQHLLKFDNDTQADMTNAAQYLALILIPTVIEGLILLSLSATKFI